MVDVDSYCSSVAWNAGSDNSITSSQSQVFVGFVEEKPGLTRMMTHVLGRN